MSDDARLAHTSAKSIPGRILLTRPQQLTHAGLSVQVFHTGQKSVPLRVQPEHQQPTVD